MFFLCRENIERQIREIKGEQQKNSCYLEEYLKLQTDKVKNNHYCKRLSLIQEKKKEIKKTKSDNFGQKRLFILKVTNTCSRQYKKFKIKTTFRLKATNKLFRK